MKKKIMILGASILQLPAIRKAKEMGLQVIAVDMDSEAVGFKEEGIICEIISTIDSRKILEAAEKYKIDGIMTLASDMPMRSVAIVSQKMGLVGITEQTAYNATNKALMRQCLRENNVPIPEFYCIDTVEGYHEVIEQFRKKSIKCIVKPADNSGSRGIELLYDFADNEKIESAFKYSKNFSRSGEIIVEEYMEGNEVSVETLSIDGSCHVIQITDKLTTGAPHFVEMGHNQPSTLSEDIKEKIAEVTIAAVNAIGIQNGPSHTEIKVTKEGPKIVELGARLGGDNITTHLVPLSTGVDMVECCINIALGEKPDINRKYCKASAIRYLEAEKGSIKLIEGCENAKSIAGVQELSIVHGIGSQSVEIKSSVDRLGFVIAQSDTAQHAIEVCEKALNLIKVTVEK